MTLATVDRRNRLDVLEQILTEVGAESSRTEGSGATTADTLRVVQATDSPDVVALDGINNKLPSLNAGRVSVEPLGQLGLAKQLPVGTASANTALTATCRRISIKARLSDVRFMIGAVAQTASNTSSHFIEVGERLDIAVPASANIAVIRDSLSIQNGTLEVTEWV